MFEPALSLEFAHLLLLEFASGASPELQHASAAVLAHVYYALDGRYDPLTCVRQAQVVLTGSAPLGPDPWVWSEVRRFLDDAERGFALEGFAGRFEVPPFETASGGFALRVVERQVLVPLPIREVVPMEWVSLCHPPADLEGFVQDVSPPFTSLGWARLRLQIHFQDLAALALCRVPQMGESWRSVQSIETRMSQLIDVIHALSTELPYVEEFAHQSPAPDPALVAGLALALGTLEGRDGLAASERYFAAWETEPGFENSLLESWGILANPAVDRVAFAWLSHPRPKRRALGVRLLAQRRAASTQVLEQAVRDSEEVACAALVPLVLSGSERIRTLLEEVELRLTNLPAEHPERAELTRAFETAGLLAGYPGAFPRVSQACREGRTGSGRLAGIAAEHSDARRFLEWLVASPNLELVDAVGWAGDPECLPYLIELLRHKDKSMVFAAAAALERITGARLVDWFEISAEAAMENDLSVTGQTERAGDGDDRDPEEEGTPDQIELPSIDPERWRAHVKAYAQSLVPGVRTRRGHPYTHMVSFFELDRVVGSRDQRRNLCYEIVLRCGVYFTFDERALVTKQQEMLQILASRLQMIPSTAGSFSVPLQRTTLDV